LALLAESGELGAGEIRERLRLKDRTHVRERYIEPALEQALIEYTLPDKPNSRLQKYRLTDMGRALHVSLVGQRKESGDE
jgi:ATP-dependent DNA helicase RecG